MDARVFAIWFVLPIVLLIEATVIRYAWRGQGGHVVPEGIERGMASLSHNWHGTAVIVGLWMVLTLVAWTYEFVFGQVLLYLVLFSMGRAAGAVGFVAFVGVLALTPVLLARVVLKLRHQTAGAPGHLPWVGGNPSTLKRALDGPGYSPQPRQDRRPERPRGDHQAEASASMVPRVSVTGPPAGDSWPVRTVPSIQPWNLSIPPARYIEKNFTKS